MMLIFISKILIIIISQIIDKLYSYDIISHFTILQIFLNYSKTNYIFLQTKYLFIIYLSQFLQFFYLM